MLNSVDYKSQYETPNKKDVKDIQYQARSCMSNMDGANNKDRQFTRDTNFSHQKDRKNSVTSLQTDSHGHISNQMGAPTQGSQHILMDQLIQEVTKLREDLSGAQNTIKDLELYCLCLIPYLGANWNNFNMYIKNNREYRAQHGKSRFESYDMC